MKRPDYYLPWILKSYLRTPRTALDVMDRFGCCKPTAYERLRAVGARKLTVRKRQGLKGPRSALWVCPG